MLAGRGAAHLFLMSGLLLSVAATAAPVALRFDFGSGPPAPGFVAVPAGGREPAAVPSGSPAMPYQVKLRIVEGEVDAAGHASTPELATATAA